MLLERNLNESQTLDTYYVYDDYNELRYVLPPRACESLIIVNIKWNISRTPAPYKQDLIMNVYDAAGSKLYVGYRTENNTLINPATSLAAPLAGFSTVNSHTDYCGNMVYENDTLSKIMIPNGYISIKNNSFAYHYYIKDHQGNNRVVVNSMGVPQQINHYYPFGGLFGGSTAGTAQKYKYNQKGFRDSEISTDRKKSGLRKSIHCNL